MSMIVLQPHATATRHYPGTETTIATATVAAVAGYETVVVGLQASLATGETPQDPVSVTLRAGATPLMSFLMAAPATSAHTVVMTGLGLACGANTAVTLEFDAAGALNTLYSVALLTIQRKL